MSVQLPLSSELCESLRMLSLKRRQGVLEILAAEREYELTFLDGRIIHADRLDTPLYAYLLKKLGDKSRTNADVTECEERGRTELIEYLAESTGVSRQKLAVLKKQYDRETLALLARERSYSFDFRSRIVRCADDLSLSLSPGHFLLDLLESREQTTPPPQSTQQANPVVDSPGKQPPVKPTVLPSRESDTPQNAKESTPDAPRSEPSRKRKKRTKKPPRVGRWKRGQSSRWKRKGSAGVPRLLSGIQPEQILTSLKLLLFLTLVMLAPSFVVWWLQELNKFIVTG